jgi:1,4-dihydroxy-2-naphthoyl-CoA hydrolase
MATPIFEHQFRVALHDTDAAGVLFFGHLFRHAHDAYEAWMAQVGLPLDAMLREGSVRLPLVHAEADYRRPLRHGAAVTIRLGVATVGDSAFTLEYAFLDADGQLAAEARTVHVGVDGDDRRLPQKLRQALVRAAAQRG